MKLAVPLMIAIDLNKITHGDLMAIHKCTICIYVGI